MGITDWFKRKNPMDNHTFTTDEQEAGRETKNSRLMLAKRRAELEKEKLELEAERDRLHLQMDIEQLKQQLDNLTGADEDLPEGNDTVDMLMAAILGMINKGQPQQQQVQQVQQPVPQPQEVTDEQIKQLWNSFDKPIKKLIKGMNDEQLIQNIQNRVPNISEESLNRCVEYVKKAKV